MSRTGVALTALLGATAVYLLIVLPSASTWIKTWLSKSHAHGRSGSHETTPLLSENVGSYPVAAKIDRTHAFDLSVAILSIIIYAAAFFVLAVTHSTETLAIGR